MGRIGQHLDRALLVDVRVLEQAKPDLGREHAADSRVEGLVGDLAGVHGRDQVVEGGVDEGHLHVVAGVDGTSGRVGSVGSAAKWWVTRSCTALGVGDDESVEAEVIAQHLVSNHGCRWLEHR